MPDILHVANHEIFHVHVVHSCNTRPIFTTIFISSQVEEGERKEGDSVFRRYTYLTWNFLWVIPLGTTKENRKFNEIGTRREKLSRDTWTGRQQVWEIGQLLDQNDTVVYAGLQEGGNGVADQHGDHDWHYVSDLTGHLEHDNAHGYRVGHGAGECSCPDGSVASWKNDCILKKEEEKVEEFWIERSPGTIGVMMPP